MSDIIVWILLLLAGPSAFVVGCWVAWKMVKQLLKRAYKNINNRLDQNGR